LALWFGQINYVLNGLPILYFLPFKMLIMPSVPTNRDCAGDNGDDNVRDGEGHDEQIPHGLEGFVLANTQNHQQIAQQGCEHNECVEKGEDAHHSRERCQIRGVRPEEGL
jgi:hypothetical protein